MTYFARIALTVLTLFAGLAVQNAALAQNDQEVENRLRRLENEIQTLGRAVFRGDVQQPPSSFRVEGADPQDQKMMANMGVRLTELENQIRQLTGQIEEQNFKIRQLQDAMQQMQQEQAQAAASSLNTPPPASQATTPMTDNMQAMPQQQAQMGASNGQPQQLGQIVQTPDGQPVVNTQNPTYVYDTAFSLLQQGDYNAAEQSLRQFISAYPDHALTANAQYWLGETYYVRNDFEAAAKAFATGYQTYPQSAKAPDSLLKLALSLSNLNKNDEACVTFAQLQSQYPKATSSILKKAQEEAARLSCPQQP